MGSSGTLSRSAAQGGARSADRRRGLVLVAAMAAVMWAAEIVDSGLGGDLDRNGILPRQVDGLDGIVLSPFLHAGFGHLAGNTIPFLMLGALIALSGLTRVALVTLLVAVLGGIGVWLVAPSNTLHIGASGLVFGYAGYLVARGFFSRNAIHLAAGALVALVWGTTLVTGLIPSYGVSWQGHVFGGLGGIIAAKLLAPRRGEVPRAGGSRLASLRA